MRRDLTHVAVVVRVFGCCNAGLFTATFTLGGFAKARSQLECCEIFGVQLVGALA